MLSQWDVCSITTYAKIYGSHRFMIHWHRFGKINGFLRGIEIFSPRKPLV